MMTRALMMILVAAGSVERYVYAAGGHGFGTRKRPQPVTSWPERFHEWMLDIINGAPKPATSAGS